MEPGRETGRALPFLKTMKRTLPVILVAAALVSGCAAGGGVPETSETPRRDLAETPASLAPTNPATGGEKPGKGQPSGSTSTDPSGNGTTGPGNGGSPDVGGADKGDGGGVPVAPTGPFRMFATMDDRSDTGFSTPDYADLRYVVLASNGVDLRVTVGVDATLPRTVGSDEVMGIGVDLYPERTQRESDYQLFVDGQPEGWFAYLQTPRGFVRYPGTFALGGNRLVFTVPLSSVGAPTTGRFSAFVDWSRKADGLTGNKASNDYAPTLGTKRYTR
jgi:hypothetical protein